MGGGDVIATFFRDYAAGKKEQAAVTIGDLARLIEDTTAAAKSELPWLKLARFGNAKTAKGSFRHDRNMIAISGVEADYDGEKVSVDEAISIAEKAGLSAIIYTSPSHTPAAPRWRVLCPTSAELPPPQRAHLVDRLNGLYGGIFASESWTASQSYYYGRVGDNPDHRVEIIEGEAIDLLDELDLIARGKPNGEAGRHGNGASGGPLDEAGLIEAIVSGEAYHSSCVRLVGKWAQAGVPFLDAQRRLEGIFDGVFPPDRDARWEQRRADIPRILLDIFGKDAGRREEEHGDGSPALWIDADDWAEVDLPLRRWIARGFALRGAVTVLTGPPSALKSSLSLAWACALALGSAHGEFKPSAAGRCLVYNAEDDATEQRRRLSAVLRQFDVMPNDIAGRVIRVGPKGVGTLLTRRRDGGSLIDTAALIELRALLRQHRPDMFVVDPLAELHDSDENDNGALRAVIAAFRALATEFDLAVVLLHHVRKGTVNPGDPDSARGASSIIGAARVVMTLATMNEEDAKAFGLPTSRKARSAYVRLDDAKQNYAGIGDARWYESVTVRLDNGEYVAAALPWVPPDVWAALPPSVVNAILDDIEAGPAEGRKYSPAQDAEERAAWRVVTRHCPTATETLAQSVIATWLKSKMLTTAPYRDPVFRRDRQGLIVAKRPT
jgi:hypothetical protein